MLNGLSEVTRAVQQSQNEKLTKCKLEWFSVLANNLDLLILFFEDFDFSYLCGAEGNPDSCVT